MTEKLAAILSELPAVTGSLVESATETFELVGSQPLAMLPVYIGIIGIGIGIARSLISFRN